MTEQAKPTGIYTLNTWAKTDFDGNAEVVTKFKVLVLNRDGSRTIRDLEEGVAVSKS